MELAYALQLRSGMHKFSLLGCIVLGACVGTIEQDFGGAGPGDPMVPGGSDGQDLAAAKQLFDANVYPIVNAKCIGGACHSETAQGATLTRFVATDPLNGWDIATSYSTLVGTFAPGSAPILTHVTAGHKGLTYTANEVAKITAWLAKEVELRNDPVTPPPAVACDNPVATNTSGEHNPGQACLNCHSAAGGETPFTLGGTLYKGVTGTAPISGATIHLVDANGSDIPLVTAQNGNFWSNRPIAFPVTVRASRCPDTKPMIASVPATGGNCNMGGCHTATLRIYLP